MDEGQCEFQQLEWLMVSFIKDELNILHQKTIQRLGDFREVFYEPPVETSVSKKTPDFSYDFRWL